MYLKLNTMSCLTVSVSFRRWDRLFKTNCIENAVGLFCFFTNDNIWKEASNMQFFYESEVILALWSLDVCANQQ